MNENPRYETQKKSPGLPFTPKEMQSAANLVVTLAQAERAPKKVDGPRNLQNIYTDTVDEDILH